MAADLRQRLASRPVRVAASECLLGSPVRWNGEHNGDVWPRDRLERLFELVGICPEVGIGMGVPREPIQLVGDPSAPQVLAATDPSIDYTDALQAYARQMAPTLAGVHGYVFADRSPSCGLAYVKVFDGHGSFRRVGRGVYADAVVTARPDLPAVDAETLADESVLLDFAVRVVLHSGTVDAEGEAREVLRESLAARL